MSQPKNKKTVHIISHTHWDREWYLPYEKHHFLLVEFMDQLIDTLDNDPNYKSFHLDGQTIILDDYLEVRPERREKLKQLIEQKRIYVGPWYILQDEFLTSSEANIRNLQYGIKDAKKWGNVSKIGYFPDSFGNIGQAPQILAQAGIKHAAFGRGVKPTGFNNLVSDADMYESPYSEMNWKSPDGNEVVGLLFANWYCNGNEIPLEREAAKKYWDGHLEAMEKYASSNHLLMLNGCDHQPVQTDLSEAIELAQELYPDIEFIHSNFNEYVKQLDHQRNEDHLKTVEGELRSQHTDGWGTLVNTASSRVYLKQMNQEVQTLLESEVEPLAAFAYLMDEKYDHDVLEYAWKILMQNHPHDSICGCSVDEVHREMVTRFEKSKHMAESMKQDLLEKLSKHIDTMSFKKFGEDSIPFAIFNTTGQRRTGVVTVELDLKREYFADGVHRKQLENYRVDNRVLIDERGSIVDYEIEDLGVLFDYDLPKNQFRQPYLARRVKISLEAQDVAPLSHQTFALVIGEKKSNTTNRIATAKNVLENDYMYIKVNSNGSLHIRNKATDQVFENLLVYEDTGDIGNEYMYKQAPQDLPITTEGLQASIKLVEDTPIRATYEIMHELEIPESAEAALEKEQQELVWFSGRKAKRSKNTTLFTIKTHVSLERYGKGIDIQVSYCNVAKDHRLRALFPTDIESKVHYADSIFEVAKRNNQPSDQWTNPDHSQHQQAFVSMHNGGKGITIANKGLNEYEVLRDDRNTIAITLVRAVRELGDWGYFPTPEAQCLGDQYAAFKIFPHVNQEEPAEVYQQAYQYRIPWSQIQLPNQVGSIPASHQYISADTSKETVLTSLKASSLTDDLHMRFFNMMGHDGTVHIGHNNMVEQYYLSNILEQQGETLVESNDSITLPVAPFEIATIGLKVKERSE
ncbi:alpha-mannosidase [Gracilibacillus salitolerans]|uniref:Alpha-mannosidase n=1 Tax=Gracilibacillus salitolerans TaxID=2663022 RepID=A0A5Q2TSJ8_9BACI|nr:alpha-mannosidase [Gracilibacillus salitolerans]QGH36630.1 alpha-mannosidase [Gracilibacillus salitolerans]